MGRMDENLVSYPPIIHPSFCIWWMKNYFPIHPPSIPHGWDEWRKWFPIHPPSISHGYDGWKSDLLSTHHPSLMGMMDEKWFQRGLGWEEVGQEEEEEEEEELALNMLALTHWGEWYKKMRGTGLCNLHNGKKTTTNSKTHYTHKHTN
jgi:hypothetical protein